GFQTSQVHLRDLTVNPVGVGGNGKVVLSGAFGAGPPNPLTGFGGYGGSVAVYLGDGAGAAGYPSRATIENLWNSIVFEGYWGLQNGFVTAVTRGVTLDSGVLTNTSRNGLSLLPSFDDAFNQVYYLGEDILGDSNGDGSVDSADITQVLRHLNKAPGVVAGEAGFTLYTWGEGDFNGDESVDSADVTLALSNLGKSYSPAQIGGDGGAIHPLGAVTPE